MSTSTAGYVRRQQDVEPRPGGEGHREMITYRYTRPRESSRWLHCTLNDTQVGGGIDLHYHEGIDADHAYFNIDGELIAWIGDREFEVPPLSIMFFPTSVAHGFKVVSPGGARLLRLGASPDGVTTGNSVWIDSPDGHTDPGDAPVGYIRSKDDAPNKPGGTGHRDMHTYRYARPKETSRWLQVALNDTREGGGIDLHYHEGIDADHAYFNIDGDLVAWIGDEEFEVPPMSIMFFPTAVPHGYKVLSKNGARVLRLGASSDGVSTGNSVWLWDETT